MGGAALGPGGVSSLRGAGEALQGVHQLVHLVELLYHGVDRLLVVDAVVPPFCSCVHAAGALASGSAPSLTAVCTVLYGPYGARAKLAGATSLVLVSSATSVGQHLAAQAAAEFGAAMYGGPQYEGMLDGTVPKICGPCALTCSVLSRALVAKHEYACPGDRNPGWAKSQQKTRQYTMCMYDTGPKSNAHTSMNTC
jgi:hypothetical protein